jgi:hypothetical protein
MAIAKKLCNFHAPDTACPSSSVDGANEMVGLKLGAGDMVGSPVGDSLGESVGEYEGKSVGDDVGDSVNRASQIVPS